MLCAFLKKNQQSCFFLRENRGKACLIKSEQKKVLKKREKRGKGRKPLFFFALAHLHKTRTEEKRERGGKWRAFNSFEPRAFVPLSFRFPKPTYVSCFPEK